MATRDSTGSRDYYFTDFLVFNQKKKEKTGKHTQKAESKILQLNYV